MYIGPAADGTLNKPFRVLAMTVEDQGIGRLHARTDATSVRRRGYRRQRGGKYD